MQTLNMGSEIIHQRKLYLSFTKVFWKTWTRVKTQTPFFHLRKAFHTIDHRTFLRKVMHYGIRGKLHFFIMALEVSCTQFVMHKCHVNVLPLFFWFFFKTGQHIWTWHKETSISKLSL